MTEFSIFILVLNLILYTVITCSKAKKRPEIKKGVSKNKTTPSQTKSVDDGATTPKTPKVEAKMAHFDEKPTQKEAEVKEVVKKIDEKLEEVTAEKVMEIQKIEENKHVGDAPPQDGKKKKEERTKESSKKKTRSHDRKMGRKRESHHAVATAVQLSDKNPSKAPSPNKKASTTKASTVSCMEPSKNDKNEKVEKKEEDKGPPTEPDLFPSDQDDHTLRCVASIRKQTT